MVKNQNSPHKKPKTHSPAISVAARVTSPLLMPPRQFSFQSARLLKLDFIQKRRKRTQSTPSPLLLTWGGSLFPWQHPPHSKKPLNTSRAIVTLASSVQRPT